ncbi:hypothetical protein JCM10213_001338 [Rhodosporidiobolus nylandii]
MLLRLALVLAALATSLATPLPRPLALEGLQGLAQRDTYDSSGDASRFGAVLALQMLARTAGQASTTGGACAVECQSWLSGLETCPKDNLTVGLSCACEVDSVERMHSCGGCLGGSGEVQAEAFSSLCAGATGNFTHPVSSVAVSSVLPSSTSSSAPTASATAVTLVQPAVTGSSSSGGERKAVAAGAAMLVGLGVALVV